MTMDLANFFLGLTTATQMVAKINRTFFGGELTSSEVLRLTSYLALNPSNTTTQRETIGLAIGSPSFQWF